MRVTLKDIALKTGLSIKHVSRALHEDPGVNAETRRRVEKIARSLGYQPNVNARNLVLNRSNCIGILIPELEIPFFCEFAISIQHCLQERGYLTLIADTQVNPARIRECIHSLSAKGIDGLVSIGSIPAQTRAFLQDQGIPVVYVAFSLEEELGQMNHVAYDDRSGGQLAARHLIELGHRRIAFFCQKTDPYNQMVRLKAFREEVERQSADFTLFDSAAQITAENGYDTSGDLAATVRRGGLDAVFCVCDSLAIGLLARLTEMGIRVPQDISIMGYDDLKMARFLNPPLTTVAQPAPSLAPPVTELICSLIKQPDNNMHRILLPPRLVPRRSTAPRD